MIFAILAAFGIGIFWSLRSEMRAGGRLAHLASPEVPVALRFIAIGSLMSGFAGFLLGIWAESNAHASRIPTAKQFVPIKFHAETLFVDGLTARLYHAGVGIFLASLLIAVVSGLISRLIDRRRTEGEQ